jgi:serine/threonine protein kinase
MADLYNLQPGSLFAGDFRVLRSLSTGGMGAVYVAEQVSTGKHRAVKVMLPQLVADPSLRKRFEQEARIASMIESEHVVEVVGAGIDTTGLPWLAMELLSGEDLSKMVARRGALPVAEVLTLFEQLCHAVAAAHRAGIVHRDLKPENIFLAQAKRAGVTFTVKVLDFGIAKIVAEAKTKQTAAMGSPIWMAPEQAERSPITPATDVWALGLVAFYLLTGRFFWKAANLEDATIPQLMREVLFEPIVPASVRTHELGLALPPAFDAWFARCVAREPAARFPDAGQAWAAMAAALGSGGAPLHPQAQGYAPALDIAPTQIPYTTPGTQIPYTTPGATPPTQAVPYAASPPVSPAGPTGPQPALGPPAGNATGGVASYTIGNAQAAQGIQGAHQPPPAQRSAAPMVAVGLGVVALIAGAAAAGLWVALRPTAPVATTAPSSEAAPLPSSEATPSPGADLAPTMDAAVALSVSEQLVLIDAASLALVDAGHAAARAPVAAVAVAPHPAAPQVIAPPVAAPPPVAPPPPPPPPRSASDLAHSSTSADWQKAKDMLEPKVIGGSATVDELRLLLEVCKNMKDRQCQRECKKQLRNAGTR